MGQYFIVVNLDKKEFIHPHSFNDGLKLLEFGCSRNGTLTALTLLLRKSSDGGGGDIEEQTPIVGSWAGDRIAIIGDYDASKLYDEAQENYKDVSQDALFAMLQDRWIKQDFLESIKMGNHWSLALENMDERNKKFLGLLS